MANVGFHAITTLGGTDYMNINAPGAPSYFTVRFNADDNLWYSEFTWNGADWFRHMPGNASQASEQAALDSFISDLNKGTVPA